MKRQVVINNKGNEFKEVEVIGEREILRHGEPVRGQLLSIEESEALDLAIDIFEEGHNAFEDGYEVLDYNAFRIRRKVK